MEDFSVIVNDFENWTEAAQNMWASKKGSVTSACQRDLLLAL